MNFGLPELLLLRNALDVAVRYENDTYSSSFIDLYLDLLKDVERYIKDEYNKGNIPF